MPSSYLWLGTTSSDPTNGANWMDAVSGATGTAPVTGDSATFQAISGVVVGPVANTDMHAVVLASLTISQSFTSTIGTADTVGGAWQIGATLVTVPPINGVPGQITGSPRIKLDIGGTSTTINIAGTGNGAVSADPGLELFRVIGSAIVAVNVTGGIVGIATTSPGETSTVGIVNVSGQATVNCGAGVTWTTASCASDTTGSGTLTLNSAGTTLTTSQGAMAQVNGTGLVGTVNAGGTTLLNQRVGGVDVTTLNIFTTGIANFSGNPGNSTVTTCNMYAPGAQLLTDPANPDHVTITTLHKHNGGALALN